MNKTLCDNWNGFSASIPGSGHIRRGLPCQDASDVVISPRPALIVCDGRGSASRSQDGAQAAVKTFRLQIAIFEPMLAGILDNETEQPGQWMQFSRIMYRTLMQVKLDLAATQGIPEKEFDFTVAFSIVGTHHIGCFQVGDGAIVLRQNDICLTAFPPDKGEFANQTHFLRENGENGGKFHAALFSAVENTGIAITSDGPEHLMFKLANMEPGRIFNQMMTDLHDQNLTRQDLMDYLTRRDWENDPRGADDRSIAILAPVSLPQADKATDTIVTEPSPAESPAASIKPSVTPEMAAIPPKSITRKPAATIQQPAHISQPPVQSSIDIFAKPKQSNRPEITFVCDIRLFRIFCTVFCLAVCLIAVIGIGLVKQMGRFQSTTIASKQPMPSAQEIPEANEDYKLEETLDQEEEALDSDPVQEETAAKHEQSPEPPNMPDIQKAEQDKQPPKPETQEDDAKPQEQTIPEPPKKQDDSIKAAHEIKPPVEGDAAPVNLPHVQLEQQKQTE